MPSFALAVVSSNFATRLASTASLAICARASPVTVSAMRASSAAAPRTPSRMPVSAYSWRDGLNR